MQAIFNPYKPIHLKHFLPGILVVLFLSGCAMMGINISHKTPHKATKYPKFSEKDSLRGALSELRNNFDVRHYDLSVDFDLKQKSIKGKVVVRFDAQQDIDKIQLDLHKNMSIQRITQNDHELTYERKYTAVFISLEEMLRAGESTSLTIEYSGKPMKAKKPPWEGGFVWKTNSGKPWVSVACEQLGANIWWPVKDHLSDEPDSMDLHYTIPEGLFCAANGSLVSQETKDGRTTFNWKIHNPINSYNVTFYIGDFVRIDQAYDGIDGVHDLTYYVMPKNKERAEEHFKQTHDILRFYEKIYGVYPWWNDGFKFIESPFAGMEHQSAIAYGNGYKKNNLFGVDYIILHEAAHEWWGNAITVSDFADVWLQEGFATYSEALFMENWKGKGYSDHYLSFYALFIKNKAPMVGPKEVNYWDYKDGDPYMKGANTLHSLRTTLDNDSLFFSILRTFYEKYCRKTVTSTDFIDHVHQLTGQDLNWFFNQYLYSRNSPKFTYYISRDGEDKTPVLHYKWTDVVDGFKMPVYIFNGFEWIRITPGTEAQTYALSGKKAAFQIDKSLVYFTLGKKRF